MIYQLLESLLRVEELLRHILIQMNCTEPAKKKNPVELFKEKWLDKQDVLLMLNISERNLYNIRKLGLLPSKMINGKMYFHISDIEKLMR